MFYYFDSTNPITNEVQRHIMQRLDDDGGVRSFPLTDENPNTAAYLAWVADGNTAEEWTGN
jgi:hypothetical protein